MKKIIQKYLNEGHSIEQIAIWVNKPVEEVLSLALSELSYVQTQFNFPDQEGNHYEKT